MDDMSPPGESRRQLPVILGLLLFFVALALLASAFVRTALTREVPSGALVGFWQKIVGRSATPTLGAVIPMVLAGPASTYTPVVSVNILASPTASATATASPLPATPTSTPTPQPSATPTPLSATSTPTVTPTRTASPTTIRARATPTPTLRPTLVRPTRVPRETPSPTPTR